jgi:hypothetical protein
MRSEGGVCDRHSDKAWSQNFPTSSEWLGLHDCRKILCQDKAELPWVGDLVTPTLVFHSTQCVFEDCTGR